MNQRLVKKGNYRRVAALRGRGRGSGGARWSSVFLCVDFTPHVLQTLRRASLTFLFKVKNTPNFNWLSPRKRRGSSGGGSGARGGGEKEKKIVVFLPRSSACRSRGLGVGTGAGSPSPWLGPSRESTRCSSNQCGSTLCCTREANSSNGTRWEWNARLFALNCDSTFLPQRPSEALPTISDRTRGGPAACEVPHGTVVAVVAVVDVDVCLGEIRVRIMRVSVQVRAQPRERNTGAHYICVACVLIRFSEQKVPYSCQQAAVLECVFCVEFLSSRFSSGSGSAQTPSYAVFSPTHPSVFLSCTFTSSSRRSSRENTWAGAECHFDLSFQLYWCVCFGFY